MTTPLRPAHTADAGILALHHHQALRAEGASDAAATAATGTFLPWLRAELEAGRLLALIAGDGLTATGSAALHHSQRPGVFDSARLLYVHATVSDASLERALVGALLAEARLRGIASLEATPAEVTGLDLEPGGRREWRI